MVVILMHVDAAQRHRLAVQEKPELRVERHRANAEVLHDPVDRVARTVPATMLEFDDELVLVRIIQALPHVRSWNWHVWR